MEKKSKDAGKFRIAKHGLLEGIHCAHVQEKQYRQFHTRHVDAKTHTSRIHMGRQSDAR